MVILMTLVARNIDEKLYKMFKAEVIKRGLKISDALEEAMKLWLLKHASNSDPEAEENYKTYLEIEDKLMKKYRGKYIIIAKGRFIGAYNTLDEISNILRKLNVRHAVVTKIGEEEVVKGEWWGGSINL
jgi:hypothetical protein